MRKFAVLALALCSMLAFTACGTTNGTTNEAVNTENTAQESVNEPFVDNEVVNGSVGEVVAE